MDEHRFDDARATKSRTFWGGALALSSKFWECVQESFTSLIILGYIGLLFVSGGGTLLKPVVYAFNIQKRCFWTSGALSELSSKKLLTLFFIVEPNSKKRCDHDLANGSHFARAAHSNECFRYTFWWRWSQYVIFSFFCNLDVYYADPLCIRTGVPM